MRRFAFFFFYSIDFCFVPVNMYVRRGILCSIVQPIYHHLLCNITNVVRNQQHFKAKLTVQSSRLYYSMVVYILCQLFSSHKSDILLQCNEQNDFLMVRREARKRHTSHIQCVVVGWLQFTMYKKGVVNSIMVNFVHNFSSTNE